MANSVQDRQHCSISFTSTGGRTDQHVFAGLVGNRIYKTLHSVQRFVAPEGLATKTVHVFYLDELLAFT